MRMSGTKHVQKPQAGATSVTNMHGPRPPLHREKGRGYGMQSRRVQMRGSRGTGLLRRLLSARALNGNGVSSPHLPLRSRALWRDWGSRDPHVSRVCRTGSHLPEEIASRAHCAGQKLAEERTLHPVRGLHDRRRDALVPGGRK